MASTAEAILNDLPNFERSGVPEGAGAAGSRSGFDLVGLKGCGPSLSHKPSHKGKAKHATRRHQILAIAAPLVSTLLEYPLPSHHEAMKKSCMQSRMHNLLEALAHPQRKLKVVHIAGSKGKGSIATMLTNVLGKSGYKVGTYTRCA